METTLKIDQTRKNDARYLIETAVNLSPDRIGAAAVRELGAPIGIANDPGAIADFIYNRYEKGENVSRVFNVPSADVNGKPFGESFVGQLLLVAAGGVGTALTLFAGQQFPKGDNPMNGGQSSAPAPKWYETTAGIVGITVGSLLLVGLIIYAIRKKKG